MDLAKFLEGGDLTPEMRVPVLTSTGAARRVADADHAAQEAAAALDRARQVEAGLIDQPRVERAEGELVAAEQERDAARTAARAHLTEFVFRPVGSALWRRLKRSCPPTDEQRKLYGSKLAFDLDMFPVVAVAFCLVYPKVPDEERTAYRDWMVERKGRAPLPPTVVTLQERLPENVWQQLWGAAVEVNEGDVTVPSSLGGSDTTRTSGPKSEPPSS